MITNTPNPPYYAVIFTSKLSENVDGYEAMADRMIALAARQDGYLGVESAREEIGITVSYWRDLKSIENWKNNAEHLMAQQLGRKQWYDCFSTRISKVERDYHFGDLHE